MFSFLLTRLSEASTWRGIVLLLTAIGLQLNPEQQNAIITMGLSAVGGLGVFLPDKKKNVS